PEEAGMHFGGIYSHFPSKEALLYHIVSETLQRQIDAVAEVCNSDLDPVAKFRAAFLTHVRTNFEIGGASTARLFLTEWRYLTGEALENVLNQRRSYERLWDGLLQEAIEAGVFRKDLDTHMARLIPISVANWAIIW